MLSEGLLTESKEAFSPERTKACPERSRMGRRGSTWPMNENNPDKSEPVQDEILHFVQNDKVNIESRLKPSGQTRNVESRLKPSGQVRN